MEDNLQEIYELGRRAHPEVPLALDAFRARAVHFAAPISPERAGDCFLAAACLEGVAAAESTLDRLYLARVEALLQGLTLTSDEADELRQRLRALLFTGRSGQTSKLAQFKGAGPLGAWLRAVAMRQALNLLRASRASAPALEELATPASNPEQRVLAQELRAALQRAIRDAATGLPEQELTALRLHLAGVSLERIAELYSAHRATVARWIQRGREALIPAVREALLRRLAISPASLDSLLGALRGKVEVDLARALAET